MMNVGSYRPTYRHVAVRLVTLALALEYTFTIVRDVEASKPFFEILNVFGGGSLLSGRTGRHLEVLGVFVGVVRKA